MNAAFDWLVHSVMENKVLTQHEAKVLLVGILWSQVADLFEVLCRPMSAYITRSQGISQDRKRLAMLNALWVFDGI
ncbi:hypothetical protein LOM8899_02215 [Flavimaricola marinus]|uniref:Uncharacterized protein n=1 Tax=Flavimaricola marinus TaxID=1819565 RepID=A0A238LED1_9RHOB|nr:hypothetical protein LOM8899_02215 [Flavimaricola marinus]